MGQSAWLFLSNPIDHCLLSDDLFVENRFVGKFVGSDHFPIVVDVRFWLNFVNFKTFLPRASLQMLFKPLEDSLLSCTNKTFFIRALVAKFFIFYECIRG